MPKQNPYKKPTILYRESDQGSNTEKKDNKKEKEEKEEQPTL